MRIEDISVGDVLTYWVETGTHAEIGYAKVLKVAQVKVFVRTECGQETWAYPHLFIRKATEWVPPYFASENKEEGSQ